MWHKVIWCRHERLAGITMQQMPTYTLLAAIESSSFCTNRFRNQNTSSCNALRSPFGFAWSCLGLDKTAVTIPTIAVATPLEIKRLRIAAPCDVVTAMILV